MISVTRAIQGLSVEERVLIYASPDKIERRVARVVPSFV